MIWRYQTPLLAVAPIIIAFSLSKLKNHWIALCLSLSLSLSLILIFSPVSFFRLQSKITRYSYTDGYVTGFDTGYQVNEIVRYLNDRAASGPIFVGLGVHTFNPESGIWAYFRKHPNVTVSYFDSRLLNPDELEKIACLAAARPLYFVAKLNDTVGMEKYLEKVTVITNPHNSDYSTVYTLKNHCTGPAVFLNLDSPITH